MTRGGRWVKHSPAPSLSYRHPARRHHASIDQRDAAARAIARFQRASQLFHWWWAGRVQNAAAPRRHDTADHALLIQLDQIATDSGWRCVNAPTSCSTVTSVWFSDTPGRIQTVLSFHNNENYASCIASLIDTAMLSNFAFPSGDIQMRLP